MNYPGRKIWNIFRRMEMLQRKAERPEILRQVMRRKERLRQGQEE